MCGKDKWTDIFGKCNERRPESYVCWLNRKRFSGSMAWASGILEVIASHYIQPMFLNFRANSFNSDARAFPNFCSARSQSYISYRRLNLVGCHIILQLFSLQSTDKSHKSGFLMVTRIIWKEQRFWQTRCFPLTENGHCDGKPSESTAFFFPQDLHGKSRVFASGSLYILSFSGLEGFTSIFQPMSCCKPNPDIKGEVFWSLWNGTPKKNQVIPLAGIWKGLLLLLLLWLRLFEEGFSSAYPAYPCQAWTFVHASHFLAPRHTEKEFRCKLSDHHGGFGMQKHIVFLGLFWLPGGWGGSFASGFFGLDFFTGRFFVGRLFHCVGF